MALAVVAVVLLVAGVKKNDQVSSLHDHGIPVSVTVTGCMGLLGGSGSNPAGYACKGTYTFDGRHYVRSIPGTALRHPGTVIDGVIVADDPGLLSTPGAVAGQRSSDSVYIAPAILFVAFLAILGWVLFAYRRGRVDGAGAES